MYDLLAYKEMRIKALQDANAELRKRNEELTTYIFELTQKDCPEDYKRVILSEIYNNE